MRLCFPTQKNKGLESEVFSHFGSAPLFILVDTEKNEVSELVNHDIVHVQNRCNPLKAINGHNVDAVIIRGIGKVAYKGLIEARITIYKADALSISKNLEKYNRGDLKLCLYGDFFPGHGSANGFSHG